MKNSILVTGAAGFIGAAVCKRLLDEGENVIGIDNINDYYDPNLKHSRLERLDRLNFKFYRADISDKAQIDEIFCNNKPKNVIHLAAQAGVRYSLQNPAAYIMSNLVGFGNILEACRKLDIDHLVYASSSSVYGGNTNMPFRENQAVNHPVSLYAATKKSNELMAHSYSHLYGLPSTGLRFFTVYGPWGRPDMAPMIFAKSIINKKAIRVFNNGNMKRDFTFIDDIVEGIIRVMRKPATQNLTFDKSNPDASTSWASHRIFNIGNSEPIPLMEFIEIMEDELSTKAEIIFDQMQPGDVQATAADTSALEDWIGFKPHTPLSTGIHEFIDWYKSYY